MQVQNISFVINLYNESWQTVNTLSSRLYELYPTSTQLFISDGKNAITYGNASFKFSERLKIPGSPGRWISRYLSVFLDNSSAEYLVKIDPDAEPMQKITSPFTGDVSCAKLPLITVDKNAFHPHAGVICFSRAYIEKIIRNPNLLNSAEFNNVMLGDREELVLRRLFKKTNANVVNRPDFCCGSHNLKKFNSATTSFWHY